MALFSDDVRMHVYVLSHAFTNDRSLPIDNHDQIVVMVLQYDGGWWGEGEE